MWKRVTPLRHSWLPKHYRRWWQQLAAITGWWWRNGKIWKYVGKYEISKKLHVPGLKYWKNPPTCSFSLLFFWGVKKKTHGFCRDSGMLSNMGIVFFVERWHPSNQSRRYCLLLMKGYRCCPQMFEVIISVICLVLGEMYVALRMCMFIFFVGKMSNLTHIT